MYFALFLPLKIHTSITLLPVWLPHAIGSLLAMFLGEIKNTGIWTLNPETAPLGQHTRERVSETRSMLQ